MFKLLRNLCFTPKSLPAFLLWTGILAFAVLVPFLGIFADDWPFLYVENVGGFMGVVHFISWVRPFGAYLFALVTSLFGQHLWAYHVFLLLMRVLDALLLYWILKLIWPKQTLPAVWVAALLVIFPSFKQQPLALEYAPHFITLGLFFLSLGSMIKAVNKAKPGWFWWLLSILTAFNLFFVEYFTGLEALRPVLLWLALCTMGIKGKERLRKTFLAWLPFIGVSLVFLVWRVYGLGFVSFQPELIQGADIPMGAKIAALLGTIFKDVIKVAFGTWVQIFSFPPGKRALLMYGALVAVAFVSVTFYLLKFKDADEDSSSTAIDKTFPWQLQWILLGFFAMLVAGWPFWITNIPLSLDFPYDRVTLPFIPGACLLATGLIGLLRLRWLQSILLGVMISLSIGLHFQNANNFRKEWEVFKPFFWQLSWRVPSLEKGTILSIENQALNYHVDKFYAPLINWTYYPEQTDTVVPLYIFDFYKLWERYDLLNESDIPIKTKYGSIHFSGSSDDLLLIAYNPPGCLRVLDAEDRSLIELPQNMIDSLGLSQMDRIISDPASPARPPSFLGTEPAHDWCYYFEKADLASQNGDWEQIVSLGNEAQANGFSPAYPSEWVPFIKGYVHTGDLEKAHELSKPLAENDFFHNGICNVWQMIKNESANNPSLEEDIHHIQVDLNCTP